MVEVVFYLLAAMTVGFALATVLSRDVFHSAVWLSVTFLCIAGIYFYLDAQFLAIVQILIYVGAIITLFIFAIMLTARIGDYTIRQFNNQQVVAGLSTAVLLMVLGFGMVVEFRGQREAGSVLSLKELGESLMTGYILPFEFLSVVLIAAMVGAIVIGKVKK